MGEIRKLKSSRGGDPPRESTPRRLAAIVAGDIAGYSRLMQSLAISRATAASCRSMRKERIFA